MQATIFTIEDDFDSSSDHDCDDDAISSRFKVKQVELTDNKLTTVTQEDLLKPIETEDASSVLKMPHS